LIDVGKLNPALEVQQAAPLRRPFFMKSELKAKFLQHLASKREDKGFTLIELLVVIIIIGILSAIALPSFLNQANKAKQSEARQNIGSMNRAQQAHYLEKGQFAPNERFGQLGLGITSESTNYTYKITPETSPTTAGSRLTLVTNQARPRVDAIKAYIGGVQLGSVTTTSEATTLATLCEANQALGIAGAPDGAQATTAGSGDGARPICPNGSYTAL
jgi:type IV pilus assembly protein PilA